MSRSTEVILDGSLYDFMEEAAQETGLSLAEMIRGILVDHATRFLGWVPAKETPATPTQTELVVEAFSSGEKTVAELASCIKAAPATIRSILSKLKREGRVRDEKGPGRTKTWYLRG